MKKLALLWILCSISLWSYSTDYFWVGGSGSWSQISHWATSSGGTTFHATVPSASDDVYFDVNSFTSSSNLLNINVDVNCRSLDFSAVTNAPTISGSRALNIYGSFILHSSMTWSENGFKRFYGTGTHTINYAGKTENSTITVSCTGSYTLQDSITCTKNITVYSGTLTTANHKITAPRISFYSTSSITLNLGTSIITSTANMLSATDKGIQFSGSTLTADADEATFLLEGTGNWGQFYCNKTIDFGTIHIAGMEKQVTLGTSSSAKEIYLFAGNGWGKISSSSGSSISNIISEDKLIIASTSTISKANVQSDLETSTDCTIDTLLLTALYGASVYEFSSGNTITITDSLYMNPGTCYESRTIKSSNSASPASLSKTTGTISVDYLSIQNVITSGGAQFDATNVTQANGTVTGWNISGITPVAYYWVVGSGNYTDPTSWALTSGGTAQSAGACIPTGADSTFFDANSFSAGGQTVTIDNTS
ncbi:MAG: hypothetical protein KJP21_07810, partial [Bacteroidia bacterium]|nr:hypothetical protein [Bacteroidia bacterium]